MNRNLSIKFSKGFTLLELLLAMAVLTILTGVVIVAINPAKHFTKAREAERQTEVYAIVTALHQYALDNESSFPDSLTTTERDICRTGSESCVGMHELSALTNGERYLVSIPIDPLCEKENSECEDNETGYLLVMTETGRVTVTAKYAELGEIIVTK